jgi:hypothetical protein
MASAPENDDRKRDEVLKRMLQTPPKKHAVKKRETKPAAKKEGDDGIEPRRRQPTKNVTSSKA